MKSVSFLPVWLSLVTVVTITQASTVSLRAQDPPPLQRESITSFGLPPRPPVRGFKSVNAFGGLPFSSPLALATPPGETNRIFVVERGGHIKVIPDLANPQPQTFLNISSRVVSGGEQGLLGLAFHPDYAENGYFYVFYTSSGTRHDRLSRFQVSPTNPNAALPTSELTLIDQRDEAGNHNGGDLHFGPDGYLYVSLGDEGGANDSFQNSQRIDKDFFAGILRIDVDKRPDNLVPNPHPAATDHYRVPADNPFVDADSFNGKPVNPNAVRTEFWAVGLRNPWRMSFDPVTGTLWCGDVGQGAREEIDIIVRGGNYGWDFREGSIPGPDASQAPPGFEGIDPVFDYGRSEGYSVTGGVVYRGDRAPSIHGAYLFSDWGSGTIWALRQQGGEVSVNKIGTDAGIAAFGIDPSNGDVLLCDINENAVKRLSEGTISGAPIPESLSGTGLFSDVATLDPAPGVVPYDVNHPYWTGGAEKRRWFGVLGSATMSFSETGSWSLPAGAVFLQHFDLKGTDPSGAETSRRLETRILVRNAAGAYGATYRWNEDQTSATLVPEGGSTEMVQIPDGDGHRTLEWQFPSRHQCLSCHTSQSGYALGFHTAQLNRSFDFDGVPANQLEALAEAGYLDQPVPHPHLLPALPALDDTAVSREYRSRAYLAVNCAHCHQPDGAGRGTFDTRLTITTRESNLIQGELLGDGGNSQADPVVIAPGDPDTSALLYYLTAPSGDRMPPLDAPVPDQDAVALLHQWIEQDLADYTSFQDWQNLHFNPSNPQAGRDADPDQDLSPNWSEFILGTDPADGTDNWQVSISIQDSSATVQIPALADRAYEVQTTADLSDPNSWKTLAAESNRPYFFPAEAQTIQVTTPIQSGAEAYFRVRVREP